jgi:hypothetical protein
MAFKVGSGGHPMWPDCLKLGVAAITYDPLAKTDLTKYPRGEPKILWNELEPSQKASLRRVVYEMAEGDVIYVKDGQRIVDRGTVTGAYRFDSTFACLLLTAYRGLIKFLLIGRVSLRQ